MNHTRFELYVGLIAAGMASHHPNTIRDEEARVRLAESAVRLASTLNRKVADRLRRNGDDNR